MERKWKKEEFEGIVTMNGIKGMMIDGDTGVLPGIADVSSVFTELYDRGEESNETEWGFYIVWGWRAGIDASKIQYHQGQLTEYRRRKTNLSDPLERKPDHENELEGRRRDRREK